MKSAEAILRIPVSKPELLFSGDEAAVHLLYRRLASRWHPDRNTATVATEVFQRIATLYATAKTQIASGKWQAAIGETLLTARDGRRYRFRPIARRPFELGELLIGKTIVSFLITTDAADLYAAALRVSGAFRYASEDMRRQIAPCLPQIQASLEGHDSCALVIKKPSDTVLLRDLAEHLGGSVPAAHVAWILSALYNLACWLEWAEISHNAIGADTLFVSPEHHGVALLGGWWYAVRFGERLSALPARTADTIPQDIIRGKLADPRSDLELIRATGRELLGDARGMRLLREPCVPQAMAAFLLHPSSGSAIADYRLWHEALIASFGARRFTRWDVTPEEIYPATH